jgi:crossover junction endodeoxyribonuclease RuvC
LRVLGIDPGSRFTGYGIVDQDRARLRCIGHGVIRADSGKSLEFRLHQIFLQLSAVIQTYRPQAVAVEGLFFFRNARSALTLGQARGVALLAAAQRGLPVYEYSPARVKRSVGAGGGDGKEAVARMVDMLLGTAMRERADASDALAVAICHLNQHRSALGRPTAYIRRRPKFQLLADRLSSAYRPSGVR